MGAARHEKNPDSDEGAWIAYSDVMNEDTHGWNGDVSLRYSQLDKPLHWKKPRRIFVVSMGDLFHEKVPFEFIWKVLLVANEAKQHIFQILTKRPKIMANFFSQLHSPNTPSNIHLGVSISTQAEADEKIPILLQIPAAVRFVSLEPLLGEIDLFNYPKISNEEAGAFATYGCPDWFKPKFKGIDWVIIGCESINGRAGRFADGMGTFTNNFMVAAMDIVEQCKAAGVPVFVKQIPINGKVSKNMAEWPEELRVQEKPDGKNTG